MLNVDTPFTSVMQKTLQRSAAIPTRGVVRRGHPIRVLIAALVLVCTSVSRAQVGVPVDLGKAIVTVRLSKVGGPPSDRITIGTGFCLTAECALVVTNYHVAKLASLAPTVSGEKVVEIDLATDAGDVGAISTQVRDHSDARFMKYAPVRDLAILRLKHALRKRGMNGISYDLAQLHPGQEVDILGFLDGNPSKPNNPKLARFACSFAVEYEDGRLGFRCDPPRGSDSIGSSASGGLVLDHKTQQAVGILEGMESAESNLAVAVPVWSLATFVRRFQPQVAYLFGGEPYRLSPGVTPTNGVNVVSVLPVAQIPEKPSDPVRFQEDIPADTLRRRTEELPEIKRLRSRAQELADNMKNFLAEQTLSQGDENALMSWSQYEIRVIDGQEAREHHDGAQGLSSLPLPQLPVALVVGDEWATIPTMVGTKLQLKVQQIQDRVEDGHFLKVFLYRAEIEDQVCTFHSTRDVFGLFRQVWSGPVACSGEVWADQDLNILRISQDLILPTSKTKWNNLHIVVSFGWLAEPDQTPELVPTAELFEGEFDHRVYWCKAEFTNYREFTAKTRLLDK